IVSVSILKSQTGVARRIGCRPATRFVNLVVSSPFASTSLGGAGSVFWPIRQKRWENRREALGFVRCPVACLRLIFPGRRFAFVHGIQVLERPTAGRSFSGKRRE